MEDLGKDEKQGGFYELLMWGVAICTVLIVFIGAAFPFGKVGNFSSDSMYKIFFSVIKNSMLSTSKLIFFCATYYLLTVTVQMSVFDLIKKQNGVIINIICGIIVLITFIPLMVMANSVSKFYGFTSNVILPISVILCVIDLIALIGGQIYLHRAKQKEPEISESEESYKHNPVPHKRKFPFIKILDVLACIVFSVAIFISYSFYLNPFSIRMAAYSGIVHPDVIAYELGENFWGLNDEDFDPYNFQTGNKVYNYRSANYEFWSERLAELKADLLVYSNEATKVTELKQKINELNEIIKNLEYENIKITTRQYTKKQTSFSGATVTEYRGDIEEILYDTQYSKSNDSSIKWNNTENKRLLCNQSIELSQTEFKVNTDFSDIKIGATILYYDGSVKKSYIKVQNHEELKSASVGEHVLKWSDSWGSYEYEISII